MEAEPRNNLEIILKRRSNQLVPTARLRHLHRLPATPHRSCRYGTSASISLNSSSHPLMIYRVRRNTRVPVGGTPNRFT